MPTSIMQKNYSHCPLKKRPVYIVKEEINHDEPENLSTKPEDLIKTGKYPLKQEVAKVQSPSPSPTADEHPSKPLSPLVPTPQYPINYHANASIKLEPLNLRATDANNNYVSSGPVSQNWHQPAVVPHHHLPAYIPTVPGGYVLPYPSETYGSLYPSHFQVSPSRSDPMSLSPQTQRESSMSPPLHYNHFQTHYSSSRGDRDRSVSPHHNYESRRHHLVKSESQYGSRFLPYNVHHSLHNQRIEHSSLSPTWSHSSYNSLISSSRRSLSPSSSSVSVPEDLSSASHRDMHSTASSISLPLSEKSSSISNIQSKPKKDHHKDSHSNAPRYQCPDCGKSYSTFSGMSKHQQFHCPAAEGNQAKKSFSCKNCDKVYVSLGALKMHIRTHTLPCKCHICGKAFSRPWLLQGHIRTHTGEKPFNCQHCQRAFADRSNLRAHLQTHSDVKKYSCTSCSKTFSRMSLLTKHSEGGCTGSSTSSSPPPSVTSSFANPMKDISVY